MDRACRDRWRELCLGDKRRAGRWAPEEDQKLTDLVEQYLQGKRELVRPVLECYL